MHCLVILSCHEVPHEPLPLRVLQSSEMLYQKEHEPAWDSQKGALAKTIQ